MRVRDTSRIFKIHYDLYSPVLSLVELEYQCLGKQVANRYSNGMDMPEIVETSL